MSAREITQVADTAFMAAAYRAIESARADALFPDPFAAKLAGEQGMALVAGLPQRAMVGGWTVIMRTHVIDAFIAEAIDACVDTVLNLGAGLDARPYRMRLPHHLRWIEVDQAAVVAWKQDCLAQAQPACTLERVALDLSQADQRQALLADVLRSAKRASVLTEAVTPYLHEATVAELAKELRAQPSVTGWLNDYFAPEAYAYRRRSGMSQAMRHAPFLFEPADYFGFFANCGWAERETRYFAIEAQSVQRPAPFPLWMRGLTALLRRLAPAQRREAMQRHAGISCLVPRSPKSTMRAQ